ncbi:putative poly(beta-D-mannuronate) O-acetylase [Paramagnetospirillum magnetotacticum MS-1]|uniref:Probable alginate O-acetylase AlgI n=1 Tax=Paramagnetospirillum magnetotacticum MS-1 TaxID=272627 RepID=A0A0C2UY56_PARME|nr:MBOAT family protein [Paramagnetospirillum magnetotacticum]KIL97741.1 putative poly(beta-D-mannuronate) O-acetylase [Paramagnetospirillum magnetotacticum MS-1]
MLFQSTVFLFAFLPVTLVVFHAAMALAGRRAALSWLVAACLFFYGWYEPRNLYVIIVTIAGNYMIGQRLLTDKSRGLLALGISLNLAALAYFKYTNFLLANLEALFGGPHTAISVVLPLGISFITFQKIAYLVDCHSGRAKKCSLLDYSLFVVFFPQLIAGPILHWRDLVPQSERLRYRPQRVWVDLAVGITIFAVGLGKKILIADSVGPLADPVFDAADGGAKVAMLEAWIGALAYTMQIYFDFSGYCDMAVGLARMFGLVLPINFFSPYKSRSIIEFWRRWHITLSFFLRDYLYIPLGGNRRGAAFKYANLVVVMLLGGLWHGAGWTFVTWGGIHGLCLVANHLWRARGLRLPGGLAWPLTMLAVLLAWVPFRAASLSGTVEIWAALAGVNGLALPAGLLTLLGPLGEILRQAGITVGSQALIALMEGAGGSAFGWLAAAVIIAATAPNVYQWIGRPLPALTWTPAMAMGLPGWLRWKPALLWSAALVLLTAWAVDRQANTVQFIYFQF